MEALWEKGSAILGEIQYVRHWTTTLVLFYFSQRPPHNLFWHSIIFF